MVLIVIDHDPQNVERILAVVEKREEVLHGVSEASTTCGYNKCTSSMANVSSLSITLTLTVFAKSSMALSSISSTF